MMKMKFFPKQGAGRRANPAKGRGDALSSRVLRPSAMVLLLLPLLFAQTAHPAGRDGDNINSKLLSAAEEGNTAKVKRLLEKGANVSAKDEYGATVLMVAVREGHTEVVKTLIDAGADANAKKEE